MHQILNNIVFLNKIIQSTIRKSQFSKLVDFLLKAIYFPMSFPELSMTHPCLNLSTTSRSLMEISKFPDTDKDLSQFCGRIRRFAIFNLSISCHRDSITLVMLFRPENEFPIVTSFPISLSYHDFILS